MEIPWLARLNTVDVQCSADRDRMHYLAHDRTTGKIYRISEDIARALAYCKNLMGGRVRNPDKEQLKAAFGFLGSLQKMHKAELSRRPPFNPLFINIELFDIGPFQPALEGLARFWVSRAYLVILFLLAGAAFWLGSWSNWEILSVFKNVFSLSAIATFALVAPFLKILHELGHTLAATRYGVRVRKTGLYLIAFYPMPFVDCTEADLVATRNQRIIISLAGLLTDIMVALVAFIAWHFVEGSFLKTILGNVFMFSSINSVLFNANPLIKLDGYYALADWLGLRNMYTEASGHYRRLRRKVMTFGADGAFPGSRRGRLLALYSFGSVLYRINMIGGILWVMLPRYFGLGALLAVWGGYAMFVSPMFSAGAAPKAKKGRTWPFWLLLGSVLTLALVFVRAPYVVVMPLQADISDVYGLQARSAGFLVERAPEGMVQQGDVLLVVENPDVSQLQVFQQSQLAMAQYAYDAISGADPAGAIVAEERLSAAKTRLALTRARLEGMVVRAQQDGYFAPDYTALKGSYLAEGARFGALFPEGDLSRLVGDFPEKYVEKFQQTTPEILLRVDGNHLPADTVQGYELVQSVSMDMETGVRSYRLLVTVRGSPVDYKQANTYARLTFAREPLYRHVQFFVAGLVQKYREAKLSQN